MSGLHGFTPPSTDRELPEKVLARIQKLLALAGDKRGNENEAANAAAMAQAILADYGLEMAQLESTLASKDPGGREKKAHDRAAMYRYQQTLMQGVAETHFCRYFLTETRAESFGKMRKVKRHVLLGRAINVRAATMIYDYLIDTMDRLLPWQGMEKRGKDALLWLDGCSGRLVERLVEARSRQEQASAEAVREAATRARHPGAAPSTGNALVLADVYSTEDDLNQDYLDGLEPGTNAAHRAKFRAEQAAIRAEQDRLISLGMGLDEAWHVARGFKWTPRATVVAHPAPKSKPETDRQRREREAREARDHARFWDKQRKANDKYNSEAYRMGRAKAEDIGLNTQVSHTTVRGIK
jgi:hypothetical protein